MIKRRQRSLPGILGVLVMAAVPLCAVAHHSFAVHFVPDQIISMKGRVTEFRFRNPHGVVSFIVTDENGKEVQWQAETNSPNILRRRGWTEHSIPVGAQVLIEGYPARDGSNYMRIYRVTLDDGILVGQRPTTLTTGDQD